ncbi:MAG: fatty acid desaturase family protein [Chroococcales cyanobacterium]
MKEIKELSQQLNQVTANLHSVNPWAGLFRFSVLGFISLSLVTLAWLWSANLGMFIVTTIQAGFVYAFWLICTHDMVHQTLTGWKGFDSVFARLISYPMVWPYGIYSELHRLHHAWNGIDLRDPERVQYTQGEYEKANPIVQWYVRHQWVINILIFGGIGLIIKTFMQGICFQNTVPRLRQQILIDMAGILTVHSLMLAIAFTSGKLLHYLLFWFLLERAVGIVVQTRDSLEHYGLWGKQYNHQLTQLYTARNLKTYPVVGWLMGGLNYHSVHHAFPGIPFNQLAEAYERIEFVLQGYDLPSMTLDNGYWQSTLLLSSSPSFIESETLIPKEINVA